ncbi:MAG: DNA alkylation repair protein [Verrucomicrobiota bacterium]
MKDMFNSARYRAIADSLAGLEPRFDAKRFLRLCLDGLKERELMDRLRQTAVAFDATAPGTFREKTALLRRHAPSTGHSFIGIWPCEFVARFGLDDAAFALDALRDLTRHGSAEFAVRPFLVRDQPGTLAVMRGWADDADEHVRRLASEGCRPRLPWGLRLQALVVDPSPTLPILEALRADPSLYVRKSVANHLNDIAKDHPEVVLDIAERWERADARTAWIVKHGLRTLIKKGQPRALALFGAGEKPRLDALDFSCSPRRIRLGDTITLSATLTGAGRKRQNLIVDYVVHYARAGERMSEKVFKWANLELAPGETATLTKRQTIRDFSTRKHHPGKHRVELQVNGQRLANDTFSILID